MGTHILYPVAMKTTIEIADDLYQRVRRLAREQKTTVRALTEAGLRLVLSGKQRRRPRQLPPLVTYGGSGTHEEFRNWQWQRIRDEIYRGRGT